MMTGKVNAIIYGAIGLMVVAAVFAALLPSIVSYLNNLSGEMTNNSIPLASLLSPTGVAGILLGVLILVSIFAYFRTRTTGK